MTCCQYPPVTFLRPPDFWAILGRPNFPDGPSEYHSQEHTDGREEEDREEVRRTT